MADFIIIEQLNWLYMCLFFYFYYHNFMWSQAADFAIELGVPSWVSISPCKQYIACGTTSGYLYILSIAEQKILNSAKIHSKGINDGVWSSDSKFIVTVGDDKIGIITDASSLEVLRKLIGHRSKVFCVAISPDNSRIITGSKDTAFRVWDPRSSKSISEIGAHTEPIASVSFNYDGTLLMTSSFDGIVRVWDSISLICLRTYVMDGAAISRSLFAPNSQYVAAFSCANVGQLIDIKSGKVFRNFTGISNSKYIINAGFMKPKPESQGEIWATSEDKRIIAWDVQTSQEIWSLQLDFDMGVANSTAEGDMLVVAGNIPGVVIIYKRNA